MDEGRMILSAMLVMALLTIGVLVYFGIRISDQLDATTRTATAAWSQMAAINNKIGEFDVKIAQRAEQEEKITDLITTLRSDMLLDVSQIQELQAKYRWMENSLVWAGAACHAKSKEKAK